MSSPALVGRSVSSGASGNVRRVDECAEARVVGVAVAPGDVAADQPGLGGMVGVVGAGEGEVAQGTELGLDAVQPRGVMGRVGELDVVLLCPLAYRVAFVGLKLSSTTWSRMWDG